MSPLVLIHGAWHGSWAWEPEIEALKSLGVAAVAVDLPVEDSTAGAEAYAEVIAAVARECAAPPVLVAHSMSGLAAPLVPRLTPIAGIVYLAALIPDPGRSMDEQFADGWIIGSGSLEHDEQGRSRWADGAAAIEAMYAMCPTAVAQRAFARLRPQGQLVYEEVTPLRSWPRVPSSYLMPGDDALVNVAVGAAAARDRLGAEAIPIDGDHSPMLSNPAGLAGVLAGFAGDAGGATGAD